MLNDRQQEHMQRLRIEIINRVYIKYVAGAHEHGDNLEDKPTSFLIDAAIDEAVDQLIYLLTLKEKMQCESQTASTSKLTTPPLKLMSDTDR
jgi:hypothetical protein